MTARTIGGIVLAVLAALGVGWLIGASGRSAVEQARRQTESEADASRARALILEGRVSLYQVNFGDASRRFEEARGVAETIQTRLREAGQAERAGRLEVVLGHLRDAQRLSASLDQSAQKAAEEALRALDGVGLDG